MYRYRFLFILVAVAGLGAGALRSLELLFDFESETGLLSYSPKYLFQLLILTGVVVLCVFFIILFSDRGKDDFGLEIIHAPGTGTKILFWITVVIHLLTGIYMVYSSLNTYISNLPLFFAGMLLIIASFSMIVTVSSLTKMQINNTNNVFLLIPVFWSCFYMIIVFKSVVANANIESYIYFLFSLIFSILAYFYFASFLASRCSLKKMVFAFSLSIYFNALSFMGKVLESIVVSEYNLPQFFSRFINDAAYRTKNGMEICIHLCGLLFTVASVLYFTRSDRGYIEKLTIE